MLKAGNISNNNAQKLKLKTLESIKLKSQMNAEANEIERKIKKRHIADMKKERQLKLK